MASVVAIVDKLHSPTLANTIMVAITAIIHTTGVTLYMYLFCWLYDIICLRITGVFSIPAIVLSFQVRSLSKKQKTIIFLISCVLLVVTVAFYVLGLFYVNAVKISCVTVGLFLVIVITLTPYLLNIQSVTSMYKPFYLLFVFLYEVMYVDLVLLYGFCSLSCDPQTCKMQH
ncbi:hypothetical protein KSF78_0002344 [Schistosoma japonicum]|nr:hypothetical protein KSF78_0002344 [Schistosoma japonicum]